MSVIITKDNKLAVVIIDSKLNPVTIYNEVIFGKIDYVDILGGLANLKDINGKDVTIAKIEIEKGKAALISETSKNTPTEKPLVYETKTMKSDPKTILGMTPPVLIIVLLIMFAIIAYMSYRIALMRGGGQLFEFSDF